MLKIEGFESQIIESFGNNKTKGSKQYRQHQLMLHMPEGGEP
jgi:hypothetical protein